MKIIPRANPNSYAAQRRAEYEKAITIGTVKCAKCGETTKTLYKVNDKPATYICEACRKVDNEQNS